MREPIEERQNLRKLIEAEFLRLKSERAGGLEKAAAEIGVHRQQMQQWAGGVPVPADVLLMAFWKWGSTIRIEDSQPEHGTVYKFSMTKARATKGTQRAGPVQLSLFEALNGLQDENIQVRVLRKGAGRIELGVEIGFRKTGH